jgi:predicted transcriptional regulator
MARIRRGLSPLEHEVMAIVWRDGTATAEEVGAALSKPLTNPTVRTLLRRLEAKGYLRHTVRGRTFVYVPKVGETQAAGGILRGVVQRFFGGSSSKLLLGLVDEGLIAPEDVADLSRRLKRARKGTRNV